MSSAFAGEMVAGVITTTGVKVPQFVYKGDSIVNPDTIYARLAVPAFGQSFKCKIRRNGTAIQKAAADAEIEIIAGNNAAAVTGLDNFTVADADYFDVDVTQFGTTPNEGSDLVWLVAP